MAGNPIHIPTGNKYQREIDLSYPHLDLHFERHYNSQYSDSFKGVGYGWGLGYGTHIIEGSAFFEKIKNKTPPKQFFIEQGDGRRALFKRNNVSEPEVNSNTNIDHQYTGYLSSDGVITIKNDNAKWEWPNGKIIIFNTAGKISRVIHPAKATQHLNYNSKGKLKSIDSSYGGSLKLSWKDNFLTTVTGPDGIVVSYDFDETDNLTSVTYADKAYRSYHYEDTFNIHHLTGITDQNNQRYSTYAYNGQGQAILSEHRDGVGRVELHHGDGITTLKNSLGQETEYHWKQREHLIAITKVNGVGCSQCGEGNVSYEYNKDLLLISKTNQQGEIESYEWDKYNRLNRVSKKTGIKSTERELMRLTYTDKRTQPTQYITPSVIKGKEIKTTLTYDESGHVTHIEQLGWRPSVQEAAASKIKRSVQLTWKNNRLLRIDGPRTNVEDVTEFDYDNKGLISGFRRTNGKHVKILSRDDAGRPTQLQHNTNIPWTLKYNPQGYITEVSRGQLWRRFTYDGNRLHSVSDTTGKTIELEYDAAGRAIGWMDGRHRGQQINLNSEGQITQQRKLGLDEQQLWFTDYTYNDQALLSQVSPQDGIVSTLNYDQKNRLQGVTQTTSTSKSQWEYVWTAANWLESVNYLESNNQAPKTLQQFEYNKQGVLKSVSDANQSETTFIFDDFGNLIAEHSPDSGLNSYDYDPANNLIRHTNALEQVTDYRYDESNQLTQVIFDDGSKHTFTYKADQIQQVNNTEQSETFTYNGLGQVITREVAWHTPQNDITKTLRTSYDSKGLLKSQELASGQVVSYEYNPYGEISDISLDGNALLIDANSLDDSASEHSYTLGNGEQVTRRFDKGQLIGMHVDGTNDQLNAQASKIEQHWSYDNRGNINTGLRNNQHKNYQYDGRDRLIESTTPTASIQYYYDSNSNRTKAIINNDISTYEYNPNGNRLSLINAKLATPSNATSTQSTPIHDVAGNLTQLDDLHYDYNSQGRLKQITRSGETIAEYAYNSWGQRVKKTITQAGIGGKKSTRKTTYFLYNGHELQAEIDESGTVLASYIYFQNRPFAKVTQNNVYYIHTNAQNAPEWMTDNTQKIVWEATYHPFGEIHIAQEKQRLNLRLPGQYHDVESGLYYNDHRYYQPQWGRYITADPSGLNGGMNRYAYANANPVMQIDPLGLDACHINDSSFQVEEQGWLGWAWGGVKSGVSATGNFVWGVGEGAYDLGKGIVILGADVVVVATPIGDAIDVFFPGTEQAIRDKYSAAGSAIWNDPGLIIDAFVAPIQDDWNNGNRAQAVGRGFFEIASLVVTPAKLGKLGKAGDIVSDVVGDAPRVIHRVEDAGNVNNSVSNLNRIVSGTVRQTHPDHPLTGNALSRNGNRQVSPQGDVPTCGQHSCAMLTSSTGQNLDPINLINQTGAVPTNRNQLASLLNNNGVSAVASGGRSIDDLSLITRNGDPAIVRITGDNGFSHWVVVDGITKRNGTDVVAIRDPHGQQYFSPLSTFEESFSGDIVRAR